MKFSYNWLRDLVEDLDASPAEVARLITIHTAECEGIEQHGDDHVVEVDNKSLTHRPDLWGHYGIAREVAAILHKKLIDPVRPVTFPSEFAPIQVNIESYDLCPRYSALVFENVTVRPSPPWLQQRLGAVGLNPINNIVDVTNFVMAELAQPIHAFDADTLGHEMFIWPARAEQTIKTLNDQSYLLDDSMLVIDDGSGPVAIAGIIGGVDSAISGSTTRMFLESANFNASSVRKTSSRLKLRTDASMRFEKAQDPVNTVRALKRAHALLLEVSPGIRLAGGLVDKHRPLPAPAPVVLSLDWLDRKLGRAIPESEVRRILEALAFRVEEIEPRIVSVFVPTWRATKDISIREDLVEEVGRMMGYDTITPVAPLTPARVPPANLDRVFHHQVRETAAEQGFTEVSNYSFVSEEMAWAFSLDPAAHVQVANPIAADHNLLRASLLPGVWKNIQDNMRNFDHFRLFEIGREVHPDHESPHFVAALYAKDDGASSLLELKRLAECLLPGVSVRPAASTLPYEHPKRAAEILYGETTLGRLFEFHPRMIEAGRAAVLDLDLALLQSLQPTAVRYHPIRRFPASAFDLSVVASPCALIAEVQSALERLAGEALLSIAFLRDFSLPTGDRSLSYRLTVGAPDGTLSAEEAGAIRSRIIEGMSAAGYELRV